MKPKFTWSPLIALTWMLILTGCSKDNLRFSPVENTSPVQNYAIKEPPDHIIIVWYENHGFDNIIGNPDASYINSLADSGRLYTNFHGITHPSHPNYVAFFSGATQGVTDDACLSAKLVAPNLCSELSKIGKTCIWYSEDLPYDGSTECRDNFYVRKHNAASDFANVPDSANKMFSELPDYNSLPNLVIITPNTEHDMHNGTIKQGDDWLRNNLKPLADWCKTNNGIFVITFDEDDRTTSTNSIPVIAYGEYIAKSTDSTFYDHYNMTKSICSLMGANTDWTSNLKNRSLIKGAKVIH